MCHLSGCCLSCATTHPPIIPCCPPRLHCQVELKKGVPPQRVLSKLLSATKLQSRFPCNMVALRGSSPETMGLREMIKHFLDFRCGLREGVG